MGGGLSLVSTAGGGGGARGRGLFRRFAGSLTRSLLFVIDLHLLLFQASSPNLYRLPSSANGAIHGEYHTKCGKLRANRMYFTAHRARFCCV